MAVERQVNALVLTDVVVTVEVCAKVSLYVGLTFGVLTGVNKIGVVDVMV